MIRNSEIQKKKKNNSKLKNQVAVTQRGSVKQGLLKISQIHRETPVPELKYVK